jgi:radical SAM enzyme (TIGR04100 family)
VKARRKAGCLKLTITYTIGDSLYVNITNRCSNRCDFCIRNNGENVGDSGSLWLEREPTADEILADILKNDLTLYKEVVFCGYGEPLIRLDAIIEVVGNLKKQQKISVRINTNGQADLIHGRPTAHELAGLIDVVSISLNTADAESYDRVCHSDYGRAAFDAVIAYAADCKKYVPSVILTVVDVISPGEIEKCRIIAQRAGVSFRVRSMIE